MESSDNKKKFTRRDFLETGISGAAGVALGLAAVNLLADKDEQPEMVKMLTADGKLVAVDKKYLPQMCGNPVAVSNKELQEWMQEGKQ